MSANFRGDPLSDDQIVAHALALRRYHGLGGADVPDVFGLLGCKSILTRFGEKRFEYQVVDDRVLGGDEAVTLISADFVRVRISQSTYDRVRDQDRRARMTMAHELMHGVLHRNEVPLARSRHELGPRFIPPFVSVERQASVGAAAYLITDAMLRRATSAAELADIARVSNKASEIRWEQEQERAARDRVGKGLRALQAELAAISKPPVAHPAALHCPVCGNRSLLPVGVRYLCTGPCDRTIDGFPDGDAPQL